jgi:hypothetical protein
MHYVPPFASAIRGPQEVVDAQGAVVSYPKSSGFRSARCSPLFSDGLPVPSFYCVFFNESVLGVLHMAIGMPRVRWRLEIPKEVVDFLERRRFLIVLAANCAVCHSFVAFNKFQ